MNFLYNFGLYAGVIIFVSPLICSRRYRQRRSAKQRALEKHNFRRDLTTVKQYFDQLINTGLNRIQPW